MTAPDKPKRIGILAFDGVAGLDLAAVHEAFALADGGDWRRPRTRYLPVVIGAGRCVTADSGLRLAPDVALEAAGALDTIVVPGGAGLREPDINKPIAAWLQAHAPHARRVVSVCTGLYALAASGLMDGRRATTHWAFAADLAKRFPAVHLEADAIFIKDGAFYTSAGMTAGIDLALALIDEDHGPALALATARHLVVYMKRAGGQMQYSEPLRFQTRAGDAFAELVARMLGDLAADWSVETMAAQVGLSTRQFARRFAASFAMPPAAYVETLRLDEARLRLATGRDGFARIAHAVGFGSDDVFRRAFERRFGITPSAYRSRFAPAPQHTEDHHDGIDTHP